MKVIEVIVYLYRSLWRSLNCVINKDRRLYRTYLCGLYFHLFRTPCLHNVLTIVWINPQLRLTNHRSTELLSLFIFCLFLTNVPTSLSLYSYINCIDKCVVLTYNHFNKFNLCYFDIHCVFHWLILVLKRGSFHPNLKRGTFEQSKYLPNLELMP